MCEFNCKIIKNKKMSLEKYIRDIQIFPKEGIIKDITPLLINAEARKSALIFWLRQCQIKGSIK
jgi:adenine/guanine phosphoribosyltransferase-like PRPP-binding protein